MAVSWTGFINGELGSSIRSKLNQLGTDVAAWTVTQTILNTGYTDTDIAHNLAIANNATDIVLLGNDITTLSNPASVALVPQATEPTHAEGKVYYDSNYHMLIVQTDKVDIKIHLGSDLPLRIINRTGVTIPALTAIRNGGVDATTKIIKGVGANADNMFTAFVLGVTVVDILPNDESWIITEGHIHDVDTSALIADKTLYLSDTVDGGLVQDNPKIASTLGTVLVSDVTNGELQIKINNLITFPQVVGYLRSQVNPIYNLTTTAQEIVGYSTSDGVTLVPDLTNGEFTLPLGGIFTVTFTGVFSFVSAITTRTVYVELYDVTNTTIVGTYPINIPREATEDGGGFSSMFTGIADTTYKLRIKSSVSLDITLDDINFSMTSNYIG